MLNFFAVMDFTNIFIATKEKSFIRKKFYRKNNFIMSLILSKP